MNLAFFNPTFYPQHVSPSNARFFYGLNQGILAEVEAQGHNIALFDATVDVFTFCQPAFHGRFDGILGMFPWVHLGWQEAWGRVEAAKPCVNLSQPSRNPGTNIAALDEEDAAGKIAAHLRERGLSRLAFLSADNEGYTLARFAALRRATAGANWEWDAAWTPCFDLAREALRPEWDRSAANQDLPEGERVMERRRRAIEQCLGHPMPEVIVVDSDPLAATVVREFAARGIRVPQDVRLVSYNDEAISLPPHGYNNLTTVRQDFQALGRQAVRLLCEIIAGRRPRQNQRALIPGELVIRQSTGAPAVPSEKDPAAFRAAAEDWLANNFAHPDPAGHLAEYFAISREYFLAKYKKITGEDFTDRVNRVRVEAAASRLRATADGILAIQLEVGFSTHQSFNRHFKERYGCTPGEYRNRLRAGADGGGGGP